MSKALAIIEVVMVLIRGLCSLKLVAMSNRIGAELAEIVLGNSEG